VTDSPHPDTLGDLIRPILGTGDAACVAPLMFRDVRDLIVGDRERGLTMRELHEMQERYEQAMRDGDLLWVDPETVGGFTDRDWSDRPRRAPRHVIPNPERLIWTSTLWLDRDRMTDPEIVDAARRELAARLDAHCAAQGMAVAIVRWESMPPPFDPTATVPMRLVADLVERTDGVWGDIRRAMAEDAADRLEAARSAADGLPIDD
jgi:hypothetical protein